jgi:hypothetical protein
MLPGFNHNIKYQDRVYHIQTEDSGVRLARVTSLLFIGGNVIARAKTEYSELRAQADLNTRVLQIMQTQHKAMLRALVSGSYDEEIAKRSHNAATLDGPAPINIEAGAQNRVSQIVTPMGISQPALAAPVAPASTPISRSESVEAEPNSPPKRSPSGKPVPGKKSDTKEKKSSAHGEPNIESLAPMLTQPAGSLPVAEKYTANKLRGAPPRAANQITLSQGIQASSPTDVIEGEKLRDAFAQNEKAVDESIFGNLISPKSLDEVILSYLANNKSSDK